MTPESEDKLLGHTNEPDHMEDTNFVSETLKNRSEEHGGPKKKKAGLLGAFGYVDKAKFDEVNQDDTDESDEDKKSRKKSIVTEGGSAVVRDEKLESMKSQVKKLGPSATAFTIFKSYVASAILYMPN